jgi:AcrR family transcriptional regulator
MNAGVDRPDRREAASEETKRRLLDAARDLLTKAGAGGLSMEAVARRAGVSRLTIYYQFGSRRALLEALYDYLAARSDLMRLPQVFHEPDALAGLLGLVGVFNRFWAGERLLIRRLRSLAALDPDFQSATQRDQWRRNGVMALLRRLVAEQEAPLPGALEETADLLSSLMSFETYDALAGEARSPEQVEALVRGAVLRYLGLTST